jgi:hypothetical protein
VVGMSEIYSESVKYRNPLADRSIPYLSPTSLSIKEAIYPIQPFPPLIMRTTILSLLGLILASSISAAPTRRAPVTECTVETLQAECTTEITTELLGVSVKIDVEGRCYQMFNSHWSGNVSDPADCCCCCCCCCSRQAG